MPFAVRDSHSRVDTGPARFERLPVLAIAAAIVLLHLLTNGRYGFHRDELQFMSDARHMDWGFVAYPPLAPFLARISMSLFGLSLVGLRSFSVAAQSVALVLTALMAKELGGGRFAQVTATLSVALSPLPLFEGTKFQYTSFDYLWWVSIAYFAIRLLESENPRWWIAIGGATGIGLLTKYSILFLISGLLIGMALTGARRYFASRWFRIGVALTVAIFLPNFLWQVRHDFIGYQFLQSIHERDIELGRTNGFVVEQLVHCINVFAAPLCVAGLAGYLRSRRYRMLGWMYIVPFVLLLFARGRSYYLAPAYPMLMAMGAVAAERWLASTKVSPKPGAKARRGGNRTKADRPASRAGRLVVVQAFLVGLVLWGAWISAVLIPFQASGPLRNFALKRSEDLRDEFGWDELVQNVAGIRDSLPAEQRADLGVIAGNYGELGAMEIFGPAYRLPAPLGVMNSAWLRGYSTPQPGTLIVLGFTGEQADALFTGCRLAGRNGNAEGVINEESRNHPDIFVCGPPREPWPEFWKDSRFFG